MLRTVTLGGVAIAALSGGCCWRPFHPGPGPALFNPPVAPIFPRLHPSYWTHPHPGPALPAALPGGTPDCPGCVGGLPSGGLPPGGVPYGAMPAGAYPAPFTPPTGVLGGGPQFSPTYFGPTTTMPSAAGSTALPPPRAGDPPGTMPMK